LYTPSAQIICKYDNDDNGFSVPDQLLYSAYQSSLERCIENDVSDVAFSLLLAGIFRGRQSLKNVLGIGATAIKNWVDTKHDCHSLQSVTLCGFSERETMALIKVCEMVLEDNDDVGTADNEAQEPDPKCKRESDSPSKEEEEKSKPECDNVTSATKETATLPQTNKDAKDSEEPADMEIDDTPVEKIETETKLEKSNNEGHLEEEAATEVVNEEKEKLDSAELDSAYDKEGVKEGEEEENQPAPGPPMDTEVEKKEQKPDEKGEVTSSS
jgi:hypothetical protein